MSINAENVGDERVFAHELFAESERFLERCQTSRDTRLQAGHVNQSCATTVLSDNKKSTPTEAGMRCGWRA